MAGYIQLWRFGGDARRGYLQAANGSSEVQGELGRRRPGLAQRVERSGVASAELCVQHHTHSGVHVSRRLPSVRFPRSMTLCAQIRPCIRAIWLWHKSHSLHRT